jgi:flagellin
MASFSVVTNLASVNAQSNLFSTNIGLRQALTRVSSGFRINYSGDDAAGLAVANSFRSEVAVLNQGVRNANDGLSMQIKDGALNNISTLLDRLSTLASQSASTSSTVNRTTLNDEFQSVLLEIDREASVAGLTAGGFSVFVSNNGASGVVAGNVGAADAATLARRDDDRDQANAATAVTTVASAITALGAVQGQAGTLRTACPTPSTWRSRRSSTPALPSRIRDANIAEESANLTGSTS